jgi:hypothetical protein
MATVVKDFKIKSGLVVEGTTGTINTYDILTKKQDDQDYIIGLIGGTATSTNTADAVVKRDGSGNFAAGTITADLTGDVTGNVTGDVTGDLTGNVTGNVTGNADTATALETARTIELTGDVTGSVSFDGTSNVQISATLDGSFATDTEVATAKQEAIDAAALDATTKADQAEADANDYTDDREVAITTAYQSYADQAELDAVATAESYTDGRETAITAAYEAYADQAEVDAKAYADSLISDGTTTTSSTWSSSKIDTEIGTAIANLVDSAPATLDTLNELAAALQDNPDIITDLQDIAAGKQDTLTAGANIDITGATISVTGLDTDDVAEGTNLYFTDARAVTANTGLWDTIGAASAAQSAAETFATNADTTLYGTVTGDIATAKSEAGVIAQGYADAAQTAAEGYADGLVSDLETTVQNLTTDDVAEGNNLYFTDSRASNAAAVLLTNASTTNISITGDSVNGLTITAENGVADSDTDDLTEGTTNLYFTDSRAVEALEAVVPNFEAVEFNSVAKQVAATASVATASTSNALTWAKADYRSAEFLVKIKNGTHTEVSKLVLTMDTSDNIAITEYAMVGTNGDLGSYSASVSGTDVALTVTTLNNNSEVMVVGTLLK